MGLKINQSNISMIDSSAFFVNLQKQFSYMKFLLSNLYFM